MYQSKLYTVMLAIGLCPAAMCQAAEQSRLVANLEAGKKQTVVTYGTSLTGSNPWVSQVRDALDRIYPGKVNVVNSGKGASSSKWGVKALDKFVIAKNPDTVFIEFAINDAFLPYKISLERSRDNLENMIERILEAHPNCEIVLMTMNPPIGVHLERRPKVEDYYQMYRDVARERGLLLIDHYPKWQKILKNDPELFNKYVPDGIHPKSEGCKNVITPNVLRALGIRTDS